MDQILALFYLVTCGVLVARMFVGKSVLDCHLGVIGAFSIGYYPLPVFFKSLSSLDYYREETVFSALLIHWLFLVFLILGAAVGRRIFTAKNPLKLALVDGVMHNYRIPLSAIAFAVYVVYFSTQRLTSYSADDFEAYFHDRGPFFAIIAAFGNMSLAYLAVSLAASWKVADRFGLLVIGGMFLACVGLTLTLGQRLIIISPIFILLASLYASGQRRRAIRLLGAGVLILLIVSPVAVYIRETRYDRQGSGQSSIDGFKYQGASSNRVSNQSSTGQT
ncbi:O-antigen polysaccharide polymerase Wzy [Aliirhizobium terrae]|uniref:O-antigen polysaccharide polymerase Wzy n=1 Tax=Terrirhizobium terrae TaxID=2926709 RepID=UPI0025751DEA|nr:O-antigen polysaccharide polymerase Wzy [Rhizobium sp. CC-CFT758]WJH39661.1 O-antigen polysaccharide polymerase Wzy [Rhizobium sp. CC-CFT758]